MKCTIFHNPRCSKSREALKLLEEKGVEPNIRLYLKDVPSKNEIKEILQKLDLEAIKIVRKSESIYKEQYKNKEYSNVEWIDILHQNPKLIERPIVIKGDKAIIGRPPSLIIDIIE